MKTKKKMIIDLLIILSILIILPSFIEYLKYEYSSIDDFNVVDDLALKNSGYWVLSPIVIDNTGGGMYTWAQAALEEWCSGSGTIYNPYLIENITIDGGGSSCITIKNSQSHFIIRNCTLYNSGQNNAGIKLENVINADLIENYCFSNSHNGIYLYNCNHSLIKKNNLTDNGQYGIFAAGSSPFYHNEILENIIINNGDNGINIASYFMYCKISNNIISDNDYGLAGTIFYSEIANNNFTGNENGIGILGVSYYNLIFENNISNNLNYGISFFNSPWINNISRNLINENGKDGIYFDVYPYCDNTTITENLIKDNLANGININAPLKDSFISENFIINNVNNGLLIGSNSRNNAISHNNISKNLGEGIYVDSSCYNNTFFRNDIIQNSKDGIHLESGDYDNMILTNNFTNNYEEGIYLGSNCDSNTISENSIINNNQKGVLINDSSCDNNLFYKNEFRLNALHVIDNGTNTFWNSSIIGNYWDNYSGDDINDDGIGDIPFNISKSPLKQDFLPIWDDGDDMPPSININSPIQDQMVGISPPYFNISVYDYYSINSTWYTLNNGPKIYITQFTGTINLFEWGNFGSETITIRFYANDSEGHINYDEIDVYKDNLYPLFIFISPSNNTIFEDISPKYNFTIIESFLDSVWYTINNGITNYTIFTGTGMIGSIIINGSIDQNAWNDLPNGNIIIRFYAKDAGGNISYIDIIAIKNITLAIPGYYIIILLGILSLITLSIAKFKKVRK